MLFRSHTQSHHHHQMQQQRSCHSHKLTGKLTFSSQEQLTHSVLPANTHISRDKSCKVQIYKPITAQAAATIVDTQTQATDIETAKTDSLCTTLDTHEHESPASNRESDDYVTLQPLQQSQLTPMPQNSPLQQWTPHKHTIARRFASVLSR